MKSIGMLIFRRVQSWKHVVYPCLTSFDSDALQTPSTNQVDIPVRLKRPASILGCLWLVGWEHSHSPECRIDEAT